MQFLNGLRLCNRALLRVGGNDAAHFLQGLITKDIESVNKNGFAYALLLNVKGRIKFDLFVYKKDDSYILETDALELTNLENTLKIYRLKRKIDFEQLKTHGVYFTSIQPKNSDEMFEDPRAHGFGYRFLKETEFKFDKEISINDYLKRRLEWGIPENLDELAEQIPMSMNADIMNGISFEKGCYIGQELIARTHHTGLIRRRLLPFESTNKTQGRLLFDENKKKQGRIIKSHGLKGIALVPVDHLDKTFIDESGNSVTLKRPNWWPSNI